MIERRRVVGRAAGASVGRACGAGIVTIMLVAACGGGGPAVDVSDLDDDDQPAGEVTTDDEMTTDDDGTTDDGATDDSFAEPRREETTREEPAEVEIDTTRIEVATLPIGGDADEVGEDLQCVDVGWSDPPEIPPGIRVVIESIVLAPAGHFEPSDQPCPGDAPSCLPDHDVTPERRCVVAVAWTDAAGEDGGSLTASGTIVCGDDADVCTDFADAVADRGGETIGLLGRPTVATQDHDEDGDHPGGNEQETQTTEEGSGRRPGEQQGSEDSDSTNQGGTEQGSTEQGSTEGSGEE